MANKYIVVSGVIFGFMSLAQLSRTIRQVPVHVGSIEIPISDSWAAAVVAGSMCAWAVASRK
jgi:hypothetical protein